MRALAVAFAAMESIIRSHCALPFALLTSEVPQSISVHLRSAPSSASAIVGIGELEVGATVRYDAAKRVRRATASGEVIASSSFAAEKSCGLSIPGTAVLAY